MKIAHFALTSALVLSACAQGSQDIAASYVSPVVYQNYSCRQIAAEAQRVSARAASLANAQDKKANSDAAATAVSLILFWPAAFFIKGDSQTAAELARLKGERDALEQVSIQKRCGIVFRTEGS